MHDDEIKSLTAGPSTLVARWHQGSWTAAVWSGGEKIVTERTESLEAAWQFLIDWLGERVEEAARLRNGEAPSAEEARRAFCAISERLSDGQRKMLKAHLAAPGHTLTASQLASAAGYKGYSGANLQYGFVGAMLVHEMPEILPKRPDGTRIATCAIASADDIRASNEEQWLWKMRPHIVQGLKASGIV